MDWETLFFRHKGQLEDFWGRRQNRPLYSREFTVFGHPVRLASNVQEVLLSADFALPLYSVAPEKETPPFVIQLIARPVLSKAEGSEPAALVLSEGLERRSRASREREKVTGPLPENLFDQIEYTGHGDWLAMRLGPWGFCHVDLAGKRALAVLAADLAEQPAMVSRYLLNTILTNFLIASGYGFLHATGLLQGRRALLLMAPHNGGKSTTALRLALAGYTLLSDSMIFVGGRGAAVRLYGFPVGRIKLRPDVVADFPQLKPLLEDEPVRGEIKYAADLRRLDPDLVHESAVEPSDICLCLLTRSDDSVTHIRPAALPAVMETVMANSLFYDEADVWEKNLARIRPLVEQARCYHLAAGSEPAGLVATINNLWPRVSS
jgi:hypothetical protein